MEPPFTPDTLDELDRRVYELAVQHIPLAELAVRLGVPVPQADEKLQRLYSRLGIANRDALRALSRRPAKPQPDPDDEREGTESDLHIGDVQNATPAPKV
ncbi:MAG: hypothetical protein AB7J35_18380 [Dehalococcoidia bacterium]